MEVFEQESNMFSLLLKAYYRFTKGIFTAREQIGFRRKEGDQEYSF